VGSPSSLSDLALDVHKNIALIFRMAAKFVHVDHNTPLLLPPDLRDWIPKGHMVHFVMDAVDVLDLSAAKINERGTGSAQYPPATMLSLLIYSYATGTFSSRKIEALTYDSVPVRLLTADTHPDHDSICKFRRENKDLLSSCFHQILELAATAKILKVGELTVSVDGTKILANASKHSAMSHDHLEKQMKLAQDQITELLAKAEEADAVPLQDGLSIPEEIQRREDRLATLRKAKKVMEERAEERLIKEQAEYEAKRAAREEKERTTGRKPGGKKPKAPEAGPRPKDQYNFTDPESRIMKTSEGFQQCYNVQAAVDAETMLIIGGYVSTAPNDKEQLGVIVGAISPAVGAPVNILADNGYYSAQAVTGVENDGEGPTVYAALKRNHHGRSVADLEEKGDPPAPHLPGAGIAEIMAHRLESAVGKALYKLRKETVEPFFGIVKEVLGFRRFSMRGEEKVNIEWDLVSLSANVKRLHKLNMVFATA